MKPEKLQFGVLFARADSRAELVSQSVEAEQAGYDVLLVADGDQMVAPFSTLGAMAMATERIKVATFVIDPWRREISPLVQELAALDRISDGRLIVGLGLGLGRMTARQGVPAADGSVAEVPQATGNAATPASNRGRVARLREVLARLERCFAGDDPTAVFQQRRPQILIGGSGEKLVEIAAEYADVLALSGPRTAPVYPALMSYSEAGERFRRFAELAGDRAARTTVSVNLQCVMVTDDPQAEAARIQQQQSHLSIEEILSSPKVAVGSVPEIAAHLRRCQEELGITLFNVWQPYLSALTPVLEVLRAG